ncbi:MAG TPA: DUF6569 family protein [Candidatus Acidoferrales bacterium]
MNRTINSIWKLFGAMTVAVFAVAFAVGGQQMDRSALKNGTRAKGLSGKEVWRILEPITYENMSVFPVVASNTRPTDEFITLDEGLSSGAVTVSERGSEMMRRSRDGHPAPAQYSGASVNELVLVNHGNKPLILLAGEMVSGGKQDRIIGKDRIVPVGADPLPLDVFCVEHGRWSNGANFSAANTMVHPSVREKAAVDQAQGEVWSAVRNGTTAPTGIGAAGGLGQASVNVEVTTGAQTLETQTTRTQATTGRGGTAGGGSGGQTSGGTANSTVEGLPGGAQVLAVPVITARSINVTVDGGATTGAYQKLYNNSTVNRSLDPFVDEVERRFARATSELKGERVVGVVIAYGGEVAWSDIFASPQLFERYWTKLLRSYVVEALARPVTKEVATLKDAEDFLRPLKGPEKIESDPDVYRWREVTEGRYVAIELQALKPTDILLHSLTIHKTGVETAVVK